MFNKFHKTIHNKYSRFFKFIFFLRYLFTIFFFSTALFLIIPNFFNYEKKAEFILDHLLQQYDFNINQYEKIKFTSFPFPKLEIKNTKISLNSSSKNLNVKNLLIYPKLFSIYNYKNFQSKKVVLSKSNVSLETSDITYFSKIFFLKKNKLLIKNLDIKISNDRTSIIEIKNVKFKNYGYDKNQIIGKIFNKDFKLKFGESFKNINFEISNLGINAHINFEKNLEKSSKVGVFRSQILNTNLKTNFVFDEKKITLNNFFFRNKNIVFSNESSIILRPFLDIYSKFTIEEFNSRILEIINLNKLIKSKDYIKKINFDNEINFKSKKYSKALIDNLDLKINLAYGRLNYSKKFLISDNIFECKGNVNLLEDFPILFFDCSIISNDKKNLLKKFSVKSIEKNKVFNLRVIGNLNIFGKKINLKEIQLNENYDASETDLKYFKDAFEKKIFNEDFIKIFKLNKIKEFIQEVS